MNWTRMEIVGNGRQNRFPCLFDAFSMVEVYVDSSLKIEGRDYRLHVDAGGSLILTFRTAPRKSRSILIVVVEGTAERVRQPPRDLIKDEIDYLEGWFSANPEPILLPGPLLCLSLIQRSNWESEFVRKRSRLIELLEKKASI